MNVEVRHLKTGAERELTELFAAATPALPGDAGIAAARAAAFDSFATTGLPHRRVEAWKYTDLRALMRDAKPLAVPPDSAAKARARKAGADFAGIGSRRLVMVDGFFAPDLSDLADLEDGLTVVSTAEALRLGLPPLPQYLGKVVAADDPALALNTAFMGDGVVIRVAAGVKVARPLQLVFATADERPAAMFTRSLLVLEAGAAATLIETHEGPDGSAYQVNTALEVSVAADARLDHIKVTREGGAALHLATVLANLDARAALNGFSFTIGGAVVRNQSFLRFAGEGAVAGLHGASLLGGRQHADTTLVADHVAPGCKSREVFKSVLDGEARSVFQGRITVRPDAQQTDARMMTRALLLSDSAEADSKPELEIFADDVQCGHGSTSGALDEDLKFYLMARGIPAAEAEALLIEAFIGETIEEVAHEGVREVLTGAMQQWLRERA